MISPSIAIFGIVHRHSMIGDSDLLGRANHDVELVFQAEMGRSDLLLLGRIYLIDGGKIGLEETAFSAGCPPGQFP